MEYFSMLAEGFEAGFSWCDQLKVFGNVSMLDCATFALVISCLWRFVLSPILGFDGLTPEQVRRINVRRENAYRNGVQNKEKNKGK